MFQLMPHQKKAVDSLDNGRILYGGVGTGKSITVLAYYMKKEAPKDIYIITTAKKRDSLEWEGDAAKFGISTRSDLSAAGLLTIDSWNNIGKYVDIEDAFFIFDEQRLVGSGAWVKSFQKIAKNNRWVLLSATPGDTWMDYIPVFVANQFYKNATQFKREHVVYAPNVRYPKVMRYLEVVTLEKYRNLVLVEMPYAKHTIRELHEVQVNYNEKLFNETLKKRWNPFEDKPIENVSELFYVLRRVCNGDPSRLEAIRELLGRHPKIVVFYNFDYELEELRKLADVTTIAEWNGHRKQPIPNTDSWVYIVQYMSGAEGWNCTSTDTMVFYSLTYSYRNFEQAQGRIDRLNTSYTILNYYIFLSNSVIDRAVRKSLAGKKLFNERVWALRNLGIEPEFGRR